MTFTFQNLESRMLLCRAKDAPNVVLPFLKKYYPRDQRDDRTFRYTCTAFVRLPQLPPYRGN
jgi:hypothetical protein